MVMRLIAVALVVPVIGLACSSGSGSGSRGTGDVSTPAGLCDQTVGQMADFFAQSCSAADKQTQDYQFIVGFLPMIEASCTSAIGASVDAGRAAIDSAQAAACASALQAALDQFATGAKPTSITQSCKSAVVGKQASGAECAQPYECSGDLTCVGYSEAGLGKCSLPAIGEACGTGEGSATTFTFFSEKAECAPGATCDSKQCVALKDVGGSCFESEECKAGLKCVSFECSSGNGCQSNDDCPDGEYCESGSCAKQKTVGAPCADNDECVGRCDTGKCVTFCGIG